MGFAPLYPPYKRLLKHALSLLVVFFIWGCAAKTTTTKAIDADTLKKEIEEICAEGARKEDVIFFIEEGDNVKAREIVRRLRWEALEECDQK